MVGIHRLCWGVLHNRVLKDSKRRTPVESDPTLMCELLVGLGEVDVVGINGPFANSWDCGLAGWWWGSC